MREGEYWTIKLLKLDYAIDLQIDKSIIQNFTNVENMGKGGGSGEYKGVGRGMIRVVKTMVKKGEEENGWGKEKGKWG